MKRIKVITMTVSKPDLFENKVNELIAELEKDKNVNSYHVNVSFSGETLFAVAEIDKKGVTNRNER